MKLGDIDPADVMKAYEHLTPEERLELDALLAGAIPEDLPGFFLCANPELKHPAHLWKEGEDKDHKPTGRSLGGTLAAAKDGPQKGLFSTPPQFGKTLLLLCALLFVACFRKNTSSAYVTYNEEMAEKKSDLCRAMAQNVGIPVTGPKRLLQLPNGSTIQFTAVLGPLEGNAVTGMLVLDDPYKSRLEAESFAYLKRVSTWFMSTGLSRTHMGTTVIVNMHRWTADDLIAELQEKGWIWTNYRALNERDESLWQELKTSDWLQQYRKDVGPFTWESEWQGNPTAKGGRLFENAHYYTKESRPKTFSRVVIGIDCAYTEKTSSDWSIAVVLGEYDGRWYVLHAIRRQCKADVFAKDLQELTKLFPGAPMRWDASTTERGTADIIRVLGKVPLQGVLAKGDAFQRAQLVSAAWRQKKVLLPSLEDYPEVKEWLPEFVRVLTTFVGGEDAQDDDVVALASAFAQAPAKPLIVAPKYGTAEWAQQQQSKDVQDAMARVRAQLQSKERAKRWGS